ncbi:MAG: hypothetical protein WCO56_11185 [Verrucomicrobiota bacterium]
MFQQPTTHEQECQGLFPIDRSGVPVECQRHDNQLANGNHEREGRSRRLVTYKMKRAIIVVFMLGLSGLFLLGWGMFGDHASFQTGLDQYEGLPPKASDITVYQNKNISGIFVADFKITEPDFRSFAAEKHWPVQPISGSTFVFQARAFHEDRANDKKVITDGLVYSQRAANGGGVTVTYDRKDSRAYIDSSSR